ncbi:hypothetical protein [Pontibacter ruber]|uniref:Uncharacterized protein n=1 Tax=Pontibacter ruber TaxID=1343895 RepID=A0ABW5CVI4_9BACT|nr:hypothetical protein [Pontibacter ruber]
MALVLHITIALLCFYLYSYTFRSRFDRLMGEPRKASDWVWTYCKGLGLIVIFHTSAQNLYLWLCYRHMNGRITGPLYYCHTSPVY